MNLVPAKLGFSVADGELVELRFENGDLVLRFVDWGEQNVEHRFVDALAFRWSARPSVPAPRDEETYEVEASPWLLDEVRKAGAEVREFAHHVLCFNADKVLEVISRRSAGTPASTAEPARTGRTKICRGDVFWIGPDEARGPAVAYSHPHVVVQDDVLNRSRISTVVVCALTSNLRRASEPGNVLLDEREGNLPERSVVVVSQISSVDKIRLGQRIGSLSHERVEQILAGLRFQQAAFFRDGLP